jgi:hypothetical protein
MKIGPEAWCMGVEGMGFSKYAKRRGAKIAKRVL